MNVTIFGATSAMAQETAKCFAAQGANFFLVGRDQEKMAAVARDLTARGAARCESFVCDLSDLAACGRAVEAMKTLFPVTNVALIAHGSLGVAKDAARSYAAAEATLRVNFLSYVALLTELGNHFEGQKTGVIAAISSVAGDRGRQSNYVYGAAKAGLSAYLSGLRNRLAKAGVRVVTVKPGFVSSPMTAHLPQGPLFISAARAGGEIHKAIMGRRDVVYVPFFWAFIMLVIKAIPEAIFKRLKL